ncbi:MAG: TetR/AcrR family transcriptional regulator [Granulosicoccus sp.]|nr:TetR/AcrR family transcriptional regulator [Granulosicoccus sp.]
MKKDKGAYHHGNLAESLLDAVDEIASQFGLEAVTLRACAKRIGVSPSSAFRHYSDKRDLLTSFATRALMQLSRNLAVANTRARQDGDNALMAVGLAYIAFAIDNPAFFRAMWNEEIIYAGNDAYVAASEQLSAHLKGGFADSIHDTDPAQLSVEELLAWSSVHGLASLLVEEVVGRGHSREYKLNLATRMIRSMAPAFDKAS